MDSVMMEASNATSAAPVQNVSFRDFLNPTEPVSLNMYLGPPPLDDRCQETKSSPGRTSDDDQLRGEANEAFENVMDQLKNDFQGILHLQVTTVAPVITDPSSTTETSSFSLCISAAAIEEENCTGYHGPSDKELRDLRSIAVKMNSKGRLDKLINVYVSERQSFMNAHFQKLWDEKLKTNDIQRLEWEVLESKIMRWIRALHCCLRGIFPLEKQLSNNLFKGLGSATGESCFVAIVTDSVAKLFDFAEALSSFRRPERLQKILQIYRRFSILIPDINSVFGSDAAKTIHGRADWLLSRLGEVVRPTLAEFEGTLLRELCDNPMPRGAVHSSTEYVIGYIISLLSESKETLTDLITDKPSICVGDQVISELEVEGLEGLAPLAAHLLWIIIILRLNLERKSKHYQDPLLGDLFMMNNVNYVVQKIRGSAVLTEIVGDNHLNKLTENVRESMTSYVRGTWDGLLYCLRHEGLSVSWRFPFGSGVSKKILQERFKDFNTLFKEIHRTQMMWEVPDVELRKKLYRSILDTLIPPYREFLGKFRSYVERGKHPERYIMYSDEDLETKVLGLFSYRSYL